MVLLLSSLVSATLCEERITPGNNCTMITPVLDCWENYTIYNETKTQVKTANMSLFNNSIYYFSFNQSEGNYLVQFCDNSTREIVVEEDSQMIYFGILLTFIFFIGIVSLLTYIAKKIWLKTSLAILLSILVMSLTRFLSWFVSINHPGEVELINTLDHFYMFTIWGFRFALIAGGFILLMIILQGIKSVGKRKSFDEEKLDW